MQRLRHLLWPVGLALGTVATLVAYDGDPALTAIDALTGFALLLLGLVAWSQRPGSGTGPIMAAAGFAWFLGSFGGWALYLHRGPIAHLVLSYPAGRLPSRLERGAVVAAYAYAAIYPLAANDYATLAFALGVVVVAARRSAVVAGPERGARVSALVAATAFGVMLALGALNGLGGWGADTAILWAYDIVVLLIAAGLFADLLWGRWPQATVTGLVVDLGEPGSAGTLRDRLARALGDPTLAIGYWLPDEGRYVDEAGQPLELPAGATERVVTPIEEDGTPIAALVHDAVVLEDPALVSAVASATRLAVSNARLQAEVRSRVAEVEASQRRIVEAADAQRRRLEQELRDGAERRLAGVAETLEGCGPVLAEVREGLGAARSELREFASGIHPAALTRGGLGAALAELAARSPVPVKLSAPEFPLAPATEVAVYFMCSEALANVAKHARASRVTVLVEPRDDRLFVEIADDGVGGADPEGGSGLRGLVDRVEALGGQLKVDSAPGRGTCVLAELPLG